MIARNCADRFRISQRGEPVGGAGGFFVERKIDQIAGDGGHIGPMALEMGDERRKGIAAHHPRPAELPVDPAGNAFGGKIAEAGAGNGGEMDVRYVRERHH